MAKFAMYTKAFDVVFSNYFIKVSVGTLLQGAKKDIGRFFVKVGHFIFIVKGFKVHWGKRKSQLGMGVKVTYKT